MGPRRARQAGVVTMSKFLLFWVWLDVQFFRLITLGNVRPGETMSACAWDMERKGKRMGKIMRPLIDWLFAWMQKDHCKQAFLWQKQIYEDTP